MSTHLRIPVRARLRQPDRAPISTYENALLRLVEVRADQEVDDAAYDLAISLVADIYWQTDLCVRRDVRKLARDVDPDSEVV